MDNKLKEVRINWGLSISELARRSNLSRVAITNIENGESNPTASTINAICKVLEKSPTEIFFTRDVIHE